MEPSRTDCAVNYFASGYNRSNAYARIAIAGRIEFPILSLRIMTSKLGRFRFTSDPDAFVPGSRELPLESMRLDGGASR